MLKTGIFRNLQTGEQQIVVVNTVQGKGERIELYNRPEDYNVVETYNAIGAYYRKTREYVYGEDSLIREYLATQNACVTLQGEVNQTSEFRPEGFTVVQSKVNEQLGIQSKITMINGIVSEEEYITKGYMISIDSVGEANTSIFAEPLNLKDYKLVTILSDFDDDDTGDADHYSLEYLKSKYALEHIEDYDYVIVGSVEEGRERLHRWRDAKVKLKSVDIESTGLEMSIFGEDLITGVVLSYDWEPLNEIENSTYFPFRQKNFEYNLPIEFMEEIIEAIKVQERASGVDPEVQDGLLLLAHNAKMEYKSFWKDNFDLDIDADTYSLSTLIDTRMERGLHTLGNRAIEATGLFWLDLDQVFKNKLIRFDILPEEIVKYYACPDGPNTIKVYKHLMKQLPTSEYYVFELESKLQRVKAINEYYGLRLNQEGLLSRLKNVEFIVDKLASIFKEWHKTSKNINSADVLRNIIYNQLGCRVVVRTEKGKPSTSVHAVSNIVDYGEIKGIDLENDLPSDIVDLYGNTIVKGADLKANRYPSLVILAAYNKYKKELSALKRLQKKSIKNRCMFGINGTGAASGRQTSDAHQYSDTMKELVLADTPYHTLSATDYAQVELRVLAYIIQDKRLIEMMKDKHIDIHRAFLSTINNIPIHEISAEMRQNGKSVNFGVVYGISEYGLARDKYGPMYTKDQLIECSRAITDFYNGIPGCKDLADFNREFVFKHGYIETKFGYRRKFPKVFEEGLDKKAKASIFRACNNTPVQGFAAHLMKQAEVNLNNYIKKMGWDKTITYMDREFPLVRTMLSIHDEVLISSHESIPKEEIVKMTHECMEIEVPGAPPFFAVPAFVDNWLQGKADEFEMSISMRDDILTSWEKGEVIVDWENLGTYIKDYKINQIKEYMTDLILKHKTVEEVTKHVNHPEFTHLLISIYVSYKDVKAHTQLECIAMAVKAYMENSDNIIEYETKDIYKEYREDMEIQDSMSYLQEVEEYIEIDETGKAMIPDYIDPDTVDDITTYQLERYNLSNDERYAKTEVGVVYLGNIVLVNTSDIKDLDKLREFHNRVMKMCDDEGYYQLNYMRDGAMMPTKFRMHPAQQELQALLDEYTVKEEAC